MIAGSAGFGAGQSLPAAHAEDLDLMAASLQEIKHLKYALQRAARAATALEIAAFAARLKPASIAKINTMLASRTIALPWKRSLAEAELAIRSDAADLKQAAATAGTAERGRPIAPWARWTAAVLIAVCIAIILYTVFLLSTM